MTGTEGAEEAERDGLTIYTKGRGKRRKKSDTREALIQRL
jgi:hypothetical protein